MVRARHFVLVSAIAMLSGCGARSALDIPEWEGGVGPMPQPEICNGLDDDLDSLFAMRGDASVDAGAGSSDAGRRDGGTPFDGGIRDGGSVFDAGAGVDGGSPSDLDLHVDEDFRDALGRYTDDRHCGACNQPCLGTEPHVITAGCRLVAESPVCVALTCDPGFTPSSTGRCVPIWDRLCLACADDGDCGDFVGAGCALVGGERRCSVDCALGCPDGYACSEGVCAPVGGSCTCDPGDTFSLACALEDPEGLRCPGQATCDDGTLSECAVPIEVCDEDDDDCDGIIDEGFRDMRGAYILDIHHCGQCGVDCTLSTVPEGDLICGGDPFAPSCVLHCPDADDGIMPGDRIDGDRIIATGCECIVTSLSDDPGPVGAVGPALDVNCDGADGIVIRSFYVATDGNDAAPGSPTRPMRTIDAALQRAAMSITTAAPRPHIFVAVGVYAETLHVPDGVQLHGGYRRDFLALDPDGFRVEVRAPSDTTAPGGAAIEVRGAGTTPTVLEWIAAVGLDARERERAAFGIYMLDPGPQLSLRTMSVRAGVAGGGVSGTNGVAGVGFMSMPSAGAPPRGAIESASHDCLMGDPRNLVAGGAGGRNVCGAVDVGGGAGGSPSCPTMSSTQPSGARGRSSGVSGGGGGGDGGQDSRGPITRERGTCPVDVCCGLADFAVPTDFMGPQPGLPGSDGRPGTSGTACAMAFGRFDGDRWVGVSAGTGTPGIAGSGGGGGGAGGGAEMDWFTRACEFADGIGGGGGGGGAGGCGGVQGTGATSGAPSVAILVRYSAGRPTGFPTLRAVTIAPSDGGRGGDGGTGGDGGRGASGAFGGELPLAARSTPTLAGPFGGGRGGLGGTGGPGGGGGGGCGGASVGVWVTGISGAEPGEVAAWRGGNTFRLGRSGTPGRGGGGGATPAPGGMEGGAHDVVVR